MTNKDYKNAYLQALKWIDEIDNGGNPIIEMDPVKLLIAELDRLYAENEDLHVQLKPNSELAEPGLLPCPFCGCSRLYVTSIPRFPGLPREWPGGMAYTITCASCAAEGGWEKSSSSARRTWNMRADTWQKQCEEIAKLLKPAVEHHPQTRGHCNLCEIYEIATKNT